MHQTQGTASTPAKNHTRVNNTPIARVEKKVLIWMAARTPAWVTPDKLTMIGLFASFMILFGYALTIYNHNFLWLASLGFVLNWFGDSMDGTLARYRKIERPRYGFFVDHIIDAVSIVLVMVGLGISPYLQFNLAMIMLVSYLLASIYVYLSTYVNGEFRISYGGLSPTEMRMIAIGANLLVFFAGNPVVAALPFSLTLFDWIIVVLSATVLVLFLYNGISTAMTLSREDRVARQQRARQERVERAERRKALRDERTTRKQFAKAARHARVRVQID